MIKQRPLFFIVAISVSLPCWSGKWFDASLGVKSSITDNALKSENNTLSERQDAVNASLHWDQQGSVLNSRIDYQWSYFNFAENSQKNRSLLQGQSRFLFGNTIDYATLLLAHSQRSVLNQQDDIDLLSNRDERQILTVEPTLQLRPSPVDRLTLSLSGNDVSYRYANNLGSKRATLTLAETHRQSEIDNWIFSGSGSDVDFEDVLADDYQRYSVSVTRSTQLRHWGYSVAVGSNHVRNDHDDKTTKPTYIVALHYQKGWQQWRIQLQRYITDSSIGGGNNFDFDTINSDVTGDEIELYESRRGIVAWQSGGLCGGCTVGYEFIYQQQRFQEQQRNSLELLHRVHWDYQINELSSLRSHIRYKDMRFNSASPLNEYTLINMRLGYQKKLFKSLSLESDIDWETRDEKKYTQWRFILGITWRY